MPMELKGVLCHCLNYIYPNVPFELRNNGPFYLAIIHNPSSNIWFKRSPMGVNQINSIMKNMIAKSPLTTKKKLTNHSARRTLIKSLKSKVPKCDIITITGHSTEAGLNPYDSGDEAQQEAISLAIDNINNNSTTTTTTKNIMNHSQFSFSPDDPRLKTPCFNFCPPQHQPVGCPLGGFNFSFNNCTVYFNGMQGHRLQMK